MIKPESQFVTKTIFVQVCDYNYQLMPAGCGKRGARKTASRGKAKSDVGGNEVSLEAAFCCRTKADNFLQVSSL